MPRLTPMNDRDRETLRDVVFAAFERNFPVIPTGSRTIGGATNDSDYDYVVFTTRAAREFQSFLTEQGFEMPQTPEGDEYTMRTQTTSFRKGKINVLMVTGIGAFRKWVKATDVAKELRPTTKEQRVTIFDSVFNGTRLFPSAAPMYTLEESLEPPHLTAVAVEERLEGPRPATVAVLEEDVRDAQPVSYRWTTTSSITGNS